MAAFVAGFMRNEAGAGRIMAKFIVVSSLVASLCMVSIWMARSSDLVLSKNLLFLAPSNNELLGENQVSSPRKLEARPQLQGKTWNFSRPTATRGSNAARAENASGLLPGALQLATSSSADCGDITYDSLADGVVVMSLFFGMMSFEGGPAGALAKFLHTPEKEAINRALGSDDTFGAVSSTDLGIVTLVNLLHHISLEGQLVNDNSNNSSNNNNNINNDNINNDDVGAGELDFFPQQRGRTLHVAKSPQLAATIQVVTGFDGQFLNAEAVSSRLFPSGSLPSIAVECRKHCGESLTYSCFSF